MANNATQQQLLPPIMAQMVQVMDQLSTLQQQQQQQQQQRQISVSTVGVIELVVILAWNIAANVQDIKI